MIQLFPSREIVVEVGKWSIHWYGLLWVAAIWLVWYLAPKLQKYRRLALSRDQWTQIIAWGAVGALVGGRLGYVLFYEPNYFFQHPAEIIALWNGGMASHGGFIGAAIAVIVVARKFKVALLDITDVLVVPVALALALGRLGNWINLEIFGNNPIAIGKNLIIALVCYFTLRSHASHVTGWFLILYGVLRFLIEPLRDDPWTPVFGLTRGQLLTLPVLVAGVWLVIWQRRQQRLLKKPTAT